MEKKEIRKKVLQLRNELDKTYRTRADKNIFQAVTALALYQQADVIFSYVSYKSEVDTFSILKKALADGKRVAIPKVMDKDGIMEFYEISSLQELIKGYQGIKEPEIAGKEPVQVAKENVLMIMPGVAFDRKCNRIGYGGGFYDRYLNKYNNKHMKTLAVCYEAQIIDTILAEATDVKPDIVLTEEHKYEK